MKPRVLHVDDEGMTLRGPCDTSLDVEFDGWRGWSVAVEHEGDDEFLVVWPKRLKAKLDGVSDLAVLSEGETLFREELSFGSGKGRVEIVDRHGNKVIIDKWGLAQRPFDARRESGAVELMTTMAERVLDVMRDECGLEGWISFGTLLGAARSGKVIGHDSDIDLCFLSEKSTPAEMAVELWDVARALQDAGISVKHKTASFITVVYDAPDGGEDGIDIYTCFYVGDLLHETATVRAPVPRSAILPLRELEFEGRMMPAPADPDRMLTESYGPKWRVPDPSFQHRPSAEITDRFDAWFGSLMSQRRDWTQFNGQVGAEDPAPSDFAHWVVEQLEGETPRVLDIGSGACTDLWAYAEAGCRAIGYDYAHPGRHALGGRPMDLPELAGRRPLNLLDERDAIASGALVARQGRRKVVTARHLLESMPPSARGSFWRFTAMALSGGGRAYLEGVSRTPEECRRHEAATGSPRVWPVDPAEAAEAARAMGGTIVLREGFATASRACRRGRPARWRMVVEWRAQEERRSR
jgi:hypothetical protein